MEALLQGQASVIEAIEKILVNWNKEPLDRRTPEVIQRRLERLEALWQEYEALNDKLETFEDKSHEYFQKNKYQSAYEYYQRIYNYLASYGKEPAQPILKPSVFTLESNLANPGASGQQQQPPPSQQPSQGQQPPPKLPAPQGQPFRGENFNLNPGTLNKGSPSKTEELVRKQNSNFKAFYRTATGIKLDEIREKWEFEDTLKALQTRWAAIDSLHWELDSILDGTNPEYDRKFDTYEQQYNYIKKQINTKMWSMSHKEKSTPQMEIPTFGGSYQHWISFKDLFTEAIHTNASLSNAQKMQFLKGKVKGEAEKLIQHLSISSDNYQTCWDILNHRYNNKKLIFTSHINTLLNLPTMQFQSSASIKKIHDTTNECLYAIKNLGVDTSSWDPILVHLITQKLDADTHKDYLESLKAPRELPVLDELMEFLEGKFTSLESSRRKQETPKSNQQHQEPKKSQYYKNYQNTSNKPFVNHINAKTFHAEVKKCPLCNEKHGLFFCKNFLEMKPEIRRKTVNKLNLCENCLYEHKNKECLSIKRCQQCNATHNTLLHGAYGVSHNNNDASTSHERSSQRKHAAYVSQDQITERLLATALIRVLSADGTSLTMRALIDPGSQISLITEHASQRLGLPRQKDNSQIVGLGIKESNCKGNITITASAMNNDYTFSTEVKILKDVVDNLPNQSFTWPSWSRLENLQLADPEFNVCRPIDILFGVDIYTDILMKGLIKFGNENQPKAIKTRLGWIICGRLKSYQCNAVVNSIDDISRFWTVEDIPDDSSNMSTEDLYCLQQYETETRRQEDGRYVVRLPLRPDINEKLGDSKQKAIAQFLQIERKFHKNKKLAEAYKAFMKEYIELGHMKPCNASKTPCYYCPHHCIIRLQAITTILRVVFNGSAKTDSGFSLNDLMYSGPNLQADLLTLILKWRQYKIAFTADIEKMFRQILCHEDDQIYQNIIWRDSANQALRSYALTTISYGLKAAPFLAMRTLKQLAKDEGQRYPEAAKILDQDFYMDDLLSGAHSHAAAMKLKADLINLLKSGGFNLRKWCSNDIELLEEVSTADSNQQAFDFKHQESTKTLGLRWNPHEDVFTFQLKINTESAKPATKRSLLSDISTIFDPLGWLCPVTTKLKLLFQSVWQQDIQWDGQLPESIINEWTKIKQDLEEINTLQVPRWLQSHEKDNIELHGFCDASENAYACVIYSKIKAKNQDDNHPASVVIVAAKSRLVPAKKSISLPRLELCAALLLSKLMTTVHQSLPDHNIKIYGWSDSTAVLGWLQGDLGRWKPFVANRVQKIQTIMPPECWQYIKSAENPADCASRGITASQLGTNDLWWQGPTWLPEFQAETENKQKYETNQEIKASSSTYQANVVSQRYNSDVVDELIKRYSSLTRTTRVLAWIMRAVSHSKQRPKYLTVPEIRKAKGIIIKQIQHSSFPEDINNLQQSGKVKADSKLLPLNPFLDQDGLLRVSGRLKNANINEEMKHPLIIPHSGHLTDLLIDHAHKMTFHGGARLTSAFLRQQFWIIGGNRAVKKRLHGCVKCRKHNPIKQDQLMCDLPSARCNPTRPFENTGVDFTGFIDVKSNKGRGIKTTKGYVAVFVCMVSKNLHLEMVSDLSSSAFLAALRRLAARRGAPRHMYSDNGTNFVGANKQLQQEIIDLKNTLDDEFFSAATEMGIEWHFNAPSWPSAGGLWEAAVKSLKHHLRRVIGEQKLTYEELSTLLAQLEACLNARPLCALTEDPEDIDFLTPSHFLASGPNLTIIETERDARTRWHLVQKIFADTWKRWKSEYLCQLSNRSKWQQPKENVKIGDIVIIHDINLPPGKWAMGRIVELHPGKDGYVRVVSLKTKNGILKRPIIKISKLVSSQTSDSEHASNQKVDEHKKDQVTSSKTKRTRSKRSCNFITMTLMTLLLFVGILSPAQCNYDIKTLNNNHSIYFDKISNMHLVRDEWKLIVYYDMEPYWQGMNLYKKYIQYLQNICSQATIQSRCNIIVLQLRHELGELEYYNNNMMHGQQIPHSRRRRGLINAVGNIAHSLFGVLDEQFAEQYQNDINLIRENQKHLALLWKNQTSVVEGEYNLIKRVEQAMDKQHKIFNQQIINLEKANSNLAKQVQEVEISNEFSLSSIIANSISINLKNIQETLLDTITNIHHGKFNIHLLTPEQLKDELNIISGQLSKELSLPINNIQTDLQHIYHLLKVKARMTNEYFIFEIKVPLISRDSFEIYKLISVPQQVQRQMISIKPIAGHIAINIEKNSYIPMTENEIQGCTQYDVDTYLCSLQKPIYQMDSDDNLCIKSQESRQCETETFTCNDSWTELSKLNTYLYSCCGQRTIKVICEHQITARQISKAGIITLGDGCVIRSDTFTIYAHKLQMNQMKIKTNLVKIEIPPINNIINVSIPTTNDLSSQSSLESDDLHNHIEDVGKKIEQMKSNEINSVLSDRVTSHDLHQYVLLYILTCVAIISAIIFAWRRLRLRCSANLTPAPPSERQGSTGPRVQFVKENETPQHSRQHVTISENIATTDDTSARVLHRATSPILFRSPPRFSE